jgi:predicted O-methyltransferase YrrM
MQSLGHFFELHQRLDQVQGYLHPMEGFALMNLAAHADTQGAVVEIGSFMGRSTCWLASGLKISGRTPAERVFAIDHFRGSPEHQPGGTHECAAVVQTGSTLDAFNGNLRRAGVEQIVTPVVTDSLSAASQWRERIGGPIRLVFIDGDHSYEASKADFEAWSPHVPVGGLVAMHDIGAWPGVTRFYEEVVAARGAWQPCLGVNSLRVLQRAA